ncbi:MAG: hypothetical protein GY757_13480, partial [bacterium]|nr:hypothetical protein [bacterium]
GNRKATRFDKQTRQWTRLRFNNNPLVVVGRVDDTMYVDVCLDDNLGHRPAVINEQTLEIMPLRFNPADPARKTCLNGPINYYGKIQAAGADREGSTWWYPVFGTDGPTCLYDPQTGYLQRLPAEEEIQIPVVEETLIPVLKILPLNTSVGKPIDKIGTIISNDDYYRGKLAGKNYYQGKFLFYPEGLSVLGGKKNHRNSGEWGPRFLFTGKLPWDVTREKYNDTIPGKCVYDILFQESTGNKWLCTDYGLILLDRYDNYGNSFSKADGLCSNRLTSGTLLNEKLYFSAGYGHHYGGLQVFSPGTHIFYSYSKSDGLASNLLEGVRKDGNKLVIEYGVERHFNNRFNKRTFEESEFHPRGKNPGTGFRPHYDKKAYAYRERIKKKKSHGTTMPWLGGPISATYNRENSKKTKKNGTSESAKTPGTSKTYICGTNGLLISETGAIPLFQPEKITVKIVPD